MSNPNPTPRGTQVQVRQPSSSRRKRKRQTQRRHFRTTAISDRSAYWLIGPSHRPHPHRASSPLHRAATRPGTHEASHHETRRRSREPCRHSGLAGEAWPRPLEEVARCSAPCGDVRPRSTAPRPGTNLVHTSKSEIQGIGQKIKLKQKRQPPQRQIERRFSSDAENRRRRRTRSRLREPVRHSRRVFSNGRLSGRYFTSQHELRQQHP